MEKIVIRFISSLLITGGLFMCSKDSITHSVTVSTFAGSVGVIGSTNGTGTEASFNNITNLVMDNSGNVYASDELNNLIRKITPEGIVSTFAGSGAQGSADGTATEASFYNPVGVAIDDVGNVYVADSFNNMIRKITSTGVVSTLAGNGSYGDTNGTGSAASFNNPHGVGVDKSGNVYVADNNNHLIRKITPGGVVSTFAGQSGVSGTADGTGTDATLANPWDLTVDKNGNVFVADTHYGLIRKITPAGVVTTIAGSATTGSTDGVGAAASFNSPTGIAVDTYGNLYVADFKNSTIRKITPGGVVSTLAGTAGVSGSTDGDARVATFNYAYGVCVNAAGNLLYVADTGNRLVRKVVIK